MTAPRVVAITPGDHGTVDRVPWLLAMARAGLRAVVIREPHLDRHALDALVLNVWASFPEISVHDRNPHARVYGAPIHLPAHGEPGDYGAAWSRSCHHEAEVDAALASGASWVTLSPVWRPTSKPADRRSELGLEGFQRIARDRAVVALGGVDLDRAERLLAAGAAGVAVSGWLFGAASPEAAAERVAALVALAD